MPKMISCRILHVFFFLFALFLLQGFLISGTVQAQAIVSVDTLRDAKAGSTAEVAVRIANPSGMTGFQFDLRYDPQIVEAADVMPGGLLPDASMFKANLNDRTRGSIRVLWLKSYDSPNVNDGGELCRIKIKVLSSGSTELKLEGLELTDQGGNAIPVTAQNGSIATGGSAPVKPPSEGSTSPGDSSSGGVNIGTASLPYAYKGTFYSCSLAATGGKGSYTWKKVGGDLPPGLILGRSGISGTPASEGKYEFMLRASDTSDGWAERSFTLWVIDQSSGTPYFHTGSANYYSYSGGASFKNLKITQGSMEMNLSPEKMPYTMIVDGGIDRISLLFNLHSYGDILYINNASHNSDLVKSVPLSKGTNEISFYVQSSGKISDKYFLTIYRMPGRM